MDEKELEELLEKYYFVYDRFTFDALFKSLLKMDIDHEEAKDTILTHCALSALVLQERIHNEYYLEIDENDTIAPDLLKLKNEIYAKHFFKDWN